MAFRFRSIMNWRIRQENLVQKEFGTVASRLIAQQRSLETLKEAELNNKRGFDQRLNNNIDVNTRILFDDYFLGLKRQQSFRQTIIAETKTQLETKRKELVSVAIKRNTLEIRKKRDSLLEKKLTMKLEINAAEETAVHWQGQFS